MRCRVDLRRGVAAATVAGLALAGIATGAAHRPPTAAITRATVDRSAHTADVFMTICFSAGPRARLAVRERRTVGGVVAAAHDWIVPRAIEPAHVSPFACRKGWRVNWLMQPRLTGPGTYTATIRVRDAYGTWSRPVAFSVTSP